MLHTIKDNKVWWHCPGNEDECDRENTAHIHELSYCILQNNDNQNNTVVPIKPQKQKNTGATLSLPFCECGAQTFLKADYTLKELIKVTQPVINEHGQVWAYTLPLRHMFNLYAHWLIYQDGRATYAPILPMPTQEVLSHPQFAAINSPETVLSLWFGFSAMRASGHIPVIENDTLSQLFITQEAS